MSRFSNSRFTGGGAGGGTYLANGAAIPSGWEAAGTTTVGGVSFTAIRQIVQAVAPAIATQPSITGNATTGSVLTLAEGAASGSPAPTPAIQWLRGTTAISGATGATYTLVSGDVGQAISARVTWTNSAGSVQATSNAITGQAPAPTATAPAQVTGLAYAAPELTWAAPADGGSAITRYDAQIVAAGASFSGAQISTSATTALDVSAQPSGDWQARVRAVNAVGNGAWSDPATFTKAAAQPMQITGVVFDGDSITEGPTFPPNYPAQFSNYTGLPVTNLGVSGRRLAVMNDTFESRGVAGLYSATNRNTLVILGGVNDLWLDTAITLDALKASIQSYIGKAKAAGFRVFVGTIMRSGYVLGAKETMRADYNAWLRDAAPSMGVSVIDYANADGLTDHTNNAYFYDAMHPNETGNARLAYAAAQAMGVPLLQDKTPDPLVIRPITLAPMGGYAMSDAIIPTGFTAPADISVSGGEYSINGGPFTSQPGLARPLDRIIVRVATPNTANATVSATLMVGTVSGTFEAVTKDADAAYKTGLFYRIDQGAGNTIRDETGKLPFYMGPNMVWFSTPNRVGAPGSVATSSYARAKVDDWQAFTRPLLVGAINRPKNISSSIYDILTFYETRSSLFRLRAHNAGAVMNALTASYETIEVKGTNTSAVAAGTWNLFVGFIGNGNVITRTNGIETARGSYSTRLLPTEASPPTRPFLTLHGAGNTSNPGNYIGTSFSESAAIGIVHDATEAMISNFETTLRAIATSKGITLAA